MYPNAPLIKRQGEVDAWDNADFRAAVRATGKKQLVMAGIVTDVCKSFQGPISNPRPGVCYGNCSQAALPLRTTESLDAYAYSAPGTTFLARSLRAEGYSVWANAEASGTTTPFIRDISNDMMRDSGVNIVSLFYIVCDLMRDWRNPPGMDKVTLSPLLKS